MLNYDPAGRWKGITTFRSHEAVICLRCNTPLGSENFFMTNLSLGCGMYGKRCPKCHLSTSYNMTPREAGAVEYEEPDWRERFETHCARWPKLPRYLAEDSAFEATLKDWRKWHAADGQPALTFDGMVALAALKIYPARNLIREVLHDGECFKEQHDAHCWMIMSQRAWRVLGIEDKTLILDSFGERTQVDLSRAKWEKYLDKAVEALMARRS